MRKLASCVGRMASRLGVALVAVVVSAPSGPAMAQVAGVLHACVERDRRDGEVHGNIRIVLPNERCRRNEARVQLSVGGGGGEDPDVGTIRGWAENCPATLGATGALAYLTGLSFVAITGETGEFELSRVPPGNYELTIHLGNYARVLPVRVDQGQTTDVGVVPVCVFSD
jgi:hypothetical protein